MSDKNKETAEQKLLKMIESTSSSAPASSGAKNKVVQKSDSLAFVKFCNRILILVVLGMAAFLAYEVQEGMALMEQPIDYAEPRMSRNAAEQNASPKFNDLAYYLTNVNRRNLFQPYVEAKTTDVAQMEEEQEISNKTDHLKLVGISWLDQVDTASVMLEDTEKGMTFFLKKGEKVGDVVVKTIYADAVELGYKSEEIILKYDKQM